KQFSINGIPEKDINQFKKSINAFQQSYKKPKESPYTATYPYPILNTATLKSLDSIGHELIDVTKQKNLTVFQFCSVRSYRERIEISIDDFEGAKKFQTLQQFEEFYAISPTYRQCYDAVVFDNEKNIIELRLDAPKGMSVEELYLAVNMLGDQFDRLANKHFGYTPCSSSPRNLYKAIGSLYKASEEGMVYELGFTASSSSTTSNNSGKLLRGRNRDLRKDPFHVGGKSQVSDVMPYRIGVEWKGQNLIGMPRLYIPGTARMLNKPPCEISFAYITNAVSKSDFEFVASKLEQHLV
ncbi:hypothetical protein, partial [Chromobacterium violaceum]